MYRLTRSLVCCLTFKRWFSQLPLAFWSGDLHVYFIPRPSAWHSSQQGTIYLTFFLLSAARRGTISPTFALWSLRRGNDVIMAKFLERFTQTRLKRLHPITRFVVHTLLLRWNLLHAPRTSARKIRRSNNIHHGKLTLWSTRANNCRALRESLRQGCPFFLAFNTWNKVLCFLFFFVFYVFRSYFNIYIYIYICARNYSEVLL